MSRSVKQDYETPRERELQARINQALALHIPVTEDGEPVGCSMCDWDIPGGDTWPCGTITALEPRP